MFIMISNPSILFSLIFNSQILNQKAMATPTNFLGTTDAKGVVLRANAVPFLFERKQESN
jgi:hypothetical protein